MITNDPNKLRESAFTFRLIASDGSDRYLTTALIQLAEEFDQEADDLESRLASNQMAYAPSN